MALSIINTSFPLSFFELIFPYNANCTCTLLFTNLAPPSILPVKDTEPGAVKKEPRLDKDEPRLYKRARGIEVDPVLHK